VSCPVPYPASSPPAAPYAWDCAGFLPVKAPSGAGATDAPLFARAALEAGSALLTGAPPPRERTMKKTAIATMTTPAIAMPIAPPTPRPASSVLGAAAALEAPVAVTVAVTIAPASGLACKKVGLTTGVIATGAIVVPTAAERAMKTLAVAVVEEKRAVTRTATSASTEAPTAADREAGGRVEAARAIPRGGRGTTMVTVLEPARARAPEDRRRTGAHVTVTAASFSALVKAV